VPVWRWVKKIPIEGHPADVVDQIEANRAWPQRSPCPSRLVHTNPGLVLTAEHVKWCRANLRNLRVVDAGPGLHLPQEENPELVGAELVRWLREPP
jgi:haloalkane dehalogenase